MDKKDTVVIFDTTLRDGEQAPCASMNDKEKLDVAYKLESLGVDIIEAGFPVISKGDFESVKNVAKNIKKSFNSVNRSNNHQYITFIVLMTSDSSLVSPL